MATISSVSKFSFKYSASITGETTTKTISGLNIRPSSDSSVGPNSDTAVTALYNTVLEFSTGDISNLRWINEKEINL